MNPIVLYFRFRWVHVPVAVLIALLQKTPVVRLVVSADYVVRSCASVLLKSGLAAAAFGAMHSRAGATTFATNPASPATATVGQSFSMVFGVTGTPTPAASYLFSNNIPPGLSVVGGNGLLVNGFTATLSGMPTTAGTFNFTVTVTNGPNQTSTGTMAGPVSFSATITVVSSGPAPSPPVITEPPASATVAPGGSVTFSVTVAGPGPFGYQWRKDGADVAGATGASLTRSNLSAADSGDYTVAVSNASGTATSRAATLLVATPAPGRLVNLSVRTQSLLGDKVLIAGFVLSGSGSKPMLVRGMGPSLVDLGVTGVMQDPQLNLIPLGGSSIAQNDNWGGTAELKDAFARTGAFAPKSDATLDAALLRTLQAGLYTAIVSGTNNTTGIALAEVYDAGDASGPRLINVSARTEVGSGDNVLIAGFVFDGNVPKRLLIRAIGPGLTRLGVTGVLANPSLRLHAFPSGALLAENDNWGGTAALKTTFQTVGAFELTNDSSTDAALSVVLTPGLYTAVVSGVGGATGVALVEVYEVP